MARSSANGTMKAVRLHEYGGADALVYEDAARPRPGPGQVLVQVRAAGVQPFDLEIRRGEHPEFGLTLPLTLGLDVSGVVAAISDDDAEGLEVGTEVWGQGDVALGGSYAEYALVPTATVGPKPKSLSHVEAAASVVAAATAYEVLFDLARFKSDQQLLVVGAGGAVGGFAVQLGKHAGARVSAVASRGEIEAVRALGADDVADRSAVSIEHAASDVHVAYDPVGVDGVWRRVLRTVRAGGVQVESNYFPSDADRAEASARGVTLEFVAAVARRAVLDELAERFDAGLLTPARVTRTFPLAQAARAHVQAERADHPPGHYVLQPAVTTSIKFKENTHAG
jgi:NADPH:quinone reductase-like Zn-dependent oxidoreductase